MKQWQRIMMVLAIIFGCAIVNLWLPWIPALFKIHFIRTIWDLQYAKCTAHQELESRASDPAPLYITSSLHGRLGNWMYAYASLLGIAKRNNRHAYINNYNILHSVFDIRHTMSWSPVCVDDYQESDPCKYDSRTENLPKVNITLKEYFQSWKYFQGIENEIRKEFKFLPEIYHAARQIFLKNKRDNSNVTVCVHVRRTDMMISSSTKLGFKAAPSSYLHNAMMYMRKKLSNKQLQFLIVSDDTDWCYENLKEADTVVIPRNRNFIDLAVLSMCNHSIITTGTFGWWGAWLAGGHTVYYKNFPEPGSRLDRSFDPADYYPPDWVAMDKGNIVTKNFYIFLLLSLTMLIIL